MAHPIHWYSECRTQVADVPGRIDMHRFIEIHSSFSPVIAPSLSCAFLLPSFSLSPPAVSLNFSHLIPRSLLFALYVFHHLQHLLLLPPLALFHHLSLSTLFLLPFSRPPRFSAVVFIAILPTAPPFTCKIRVRDN